MGIKENGKDIKANNQALEQGVILAAQLSEEARNLNQELKDQLGIRQKTNDFDNLY